MKADGARASLQCDSRSCKESDSDMTVLTFDLEKTLPTPVLTTGICYYKRQLWTYNFGVHNMNTDTGFMYVWDESTASRGAEEVASALFLHIKKHVKTTRLVCFSDCCGGQNRNIKLALMWNYIVQRPDIPVTEIDHKFLIPGHTYLPNDQDFGLVEKNKRAFSDVYVPADWIKVIQTAKKQNPKFVVTQMTRDDFFSTKVLEQNSVNRKKDRDGNGVSWLKIHWMRFSADHPNVMFYKYTTRPTEEALFMTVDLSKRTRGRDRNVAALELELLYPDGKAIAKAKLLDLKSLLPFIPPVNHDFYKHLKCDAAEVDEAIWSDSASEAESDD